MNETEQITFREFKDALLLTKDNISIFLAAFFSALIHICFFIIPNYKQIKLPRSITVSIIPASTLNQLVNPREKQIVSTPEKRVKKTDLDSKFKSDVDSTVAEEKIKRGDSPDAANAANTATAKIAVQKKLAQAPAPQKKQEAPSQLKENSTGKLNLNPNFKALVKLDNNKKSEAETPSNKASSASPFSRAQGSSAAFVGQNGVPDYLPGVRDGDITLLNTKADKYAVFVRRIATQVFNEIKRNEWQSITFSEIQSMNSPTTIRAVLSPTGKLLNINLEQSSTSSAFDSIVLKSTTSGAHDPNPPIEARASDGNFHFIFIARTWSKIAPAGRQGIPQEFRWLLLQTGLD